MENSLKEKYKKYFHIGAAVNKYTVQSHKDIIVKHFDSLTCENEMKYSNLCINDGVYDFTDANSIRDFAKSNKLLLRGHTLVWHNQTPDFIFQDNDKNKLRQTLRDHMHLIAENYGEDIYCWDVVNEAIEDKDSEFFRKTKWLEIMGDHYIDTVFSDARDIFPNASLFYNDYNETDPEKQKKIYSLLESMLERGIPIDGIGLQCHWNIFEPSFDRIKATIELFAKLNLKIHITEMDVSVFAFDDHTKLQQLTAKHLESQANVYAQAFALFREYSDMIECVTLWGVADDSTWLSNFPAANRKNWPLLFDDRHEPKESFYRILQF